MSEFSASVVVNMREGCDGFCCGFWGLVEGRPFVTVYFLRGTGRSVKADLLTVTSSTRVGSDLLPSELVKIFMFTNGSFWRHIKEIHWTRSPKRFEESSRL